MSKICETFADKYFADKLNADISVLNYRNGKLNWTTGIFEPRNSNDYFSLFIGEDYVPGSYNVDEDDGETIHQFCKNDEAIYSECLDLLTLKLCSPPTSPNHHLFRNRWDDLKIKSNHKRQLLQMIQPISQSMVQLLLEHHMAK